MEYKVRKYTNDDFLKFRNFLVKTFGKFNKHINWSIERLNFSTSLARTMHEKTMEEWAEKVRIWEDEYGDILAICNSEGEDKGEAFFQVSTLDLPESLFIEMFEFIENNDFYKKEEKREYLQLRIPEGYTLLENIAEKRGYKKIDYYEPTSELKLSEDFKVELPEGFRIVDGNEVTDIDKARAHGLAFGYYESDDDIVPLGFERMRKSYDYKADLDLSILNEAGEIVAFCTVWYDEENQMGVLEPVGTHADYRKLGLAKAVIFEGLNRMRAKGANRAYVGNNIPFYLAIGFKEVHKNRIWEKEIKY